MKTLYSRSNVKIWNSRHSSNLYAFTFVKLNNEVSHQMLPRTTASNAR